jgi:hypothetical protein
MDHSTVCFHLGCNGNRRCGCHEGQVGGHRAPALRESA